MSFVNTQSPAVLKKPTGASLVGMGNGETVEQGLSKRPINIGTFADFAITEMEVGQSFNLLGHTLPNVGGGLFIAKSGVVSTDAGMRSQSATAGVFVERQHSGKLQFEFFGVVGSGDEQALMQEAINYAMENNLSLQGRAEYSCGSQLLVRAYRQEPPVFLEYTRAKIAINKLKYTGVVDAAIRVESPKAQVVIDELIGPGPSAGTTSGLQIIGLGDAHHRVGTVRGFTNNIDFEGAYSNTVYLGWSDDSIRGVRVNGNQNIIMGGRIGGPFVTSAINPNSCEIGVDILPGSAGTRIFSNIEYCRRSESAIGLRDRGVGTRFYGYTESCAAKNISALGRDGVFEVIAGGTNVDEPAGYHAEFSNKILLMSQMDRGEEIVDGSNSTMAFALNQAISKSGGGVIEGSRGFSSRISSALPAVNEVLQSSDFTVSPWGAGTVGAASWAAVTIAASNNVYGDLGYLSGTRFTFPAMSGDDDIYRLSQSGILVSGGQLSYGVWAACESGDVEIQVRVVYSGYQVRSLTRLTESDGYFKIGSEEIQSLGVDSNALFEISFRSRSGGVVSLFGAYVVNGLGVESAPVNFSVKRPVIKGEGVRGNTFYNGARINGKIQCGISPLVTSSITISSESNAYHTFIVSGGAPKNITLLPGSSGDLITFKRDGAAGVVNLVPSATTIDGSAASVDFSAAWSIVRLHFDESLGWLKL